MSRTVRSTLLVCLALLAMGSAARQKPGPESVHPDFQGIWSFATLTPLERDARPGELANKPDLTDAEADEFVRQRLAAANADGRPMSDYNEFWFERPTGLVRVNGRNLTSRIVDPADGRLPPLTPAAKARMDALQKERREHPADGPEVRSLAERCLQVAPVIEPNGGGNNNFVRIVQTAGHLLMFTEQQMLRIVTIGPRAHLPPAIRMPLGDSRGSWEGGALVVDTTNFTGRFDFSFRPVDENLHLRERLRLVDADTLLLESTVDDPTAFTRPWTMMLSMARANTRMFEYACHEGNYALRHILSGARAEEARR